ncbi:alpha/beta fold hydrolase [Nonomuraea sp. NPDC050227]|uniref:alpha/beta fold hydrolase n=1 Tax=Nonomuraea sp. NPDC050227 TaxID=3364360 RepID=UPI0037B32C16
MFFQTTDGTRLAYEDYGQGKPIVFVASVMLSADMWEYQIPYFVERGYRCVALDRRAHGRSDRPSTGYDLDTGADDLAELIELLDLRDITLVGHSMGGAEVARYLARHGDERVARVAFVSAMLPFLLQTDDNPEGVPGAALEASMAALDADRPKWLAQRAQAFFATHLGNEISPAQVEFTLRQCLEVSPWAIRQYQRAAMTFDHRASLAEIAVPALVVHGAADASIPVAVSGRRTAKLVPGATYLEYPTGGHGLFVTHRDRFNDDLHTFIKST